jgi:hypothetical protein
MLFLIMKDAGRLAPQTWIHGIVRWGIVGTYMMMALIRCCSVANKEGQ